MFPEIGEMLFDDHLYLLKMKVEQTKTWLDEDYITTEQLEQVFKDLVEGDNHGIWNSHNHRTIHHPVHMEIQQGY